MGFIQNISRRLKRRASLPAAFALSAALSASAASGQTLESVVGSSHVQNPAAVGQSLLDGMDAQDASQLILTTDGYGRWKGKAVEAQTGSQPEEHLAYVVTENQRARQDGQVDGLYSVGAAVDMGNSDATTDIEIEFPDGEAISTDDRSVEWQVQLNGGPDYAGELDPHEDFDGEGELLRHVLQETLRARTFTGNDMPAEIFITPDSSDTLVHVYPKTASGSYAGQLAVRVDNVDLQNGGFESADFSLLPDCTGNVAPGCTDPNTVGVELVGVPRVGSGEFYEESDVRLLVSRAQNGSGQAFGTLESEILNSAPWVVTGDTSPCVEDATALCLLDGRFAVSVYWEDTRNGNEGYGQVLPDVHPSGGSSSDYGAFWFFNSSNPELIVKMLDGTSLNEHFWEFYGALSDVKYVVTTRDTENGRIRQLVNPDRNLAGGADTKFFGPDGGMPGNDTSPCIEDIDTACLLDGRYEVEVSWNDTRNNQMGEGQITYTNPGQDVTSDYVIMSFFNPSNPELIVKMLDGRSVNEHAWAFYGALSDVEYTIEFRDTETGDTNFFHNPDRNLAGGADTKFIPEELSGDAERMEMLRQMVETDATGPDAVYTVLSPGRGGSIVINGTKSQFVDGRNSQTSEVKNMNTLFRLVPYDRDGGMESRVMLLSNERASTNLDGVDVRVRLVEDGNVLETTNLPNGQRVDSGYLPSADDIMFTTADYSDRDIHRMEEVHPRTIVPRVLSGPLANRTDLSSEAVVYPTGNDTDRIEHHLGSNGQYGVIVADLEVTYHSNGELDRGVATIDQSATHSDPSVVSSAGVLFREPVHPDMPVTFDLCDDYRIGGIEGAGSFNITNEGGTQNDTAFIRYTFSEGSSSIGLLDCTDITEPSE